MKEINKPSILIFRIMLSSIFLVAGINHLLKPEKVATRLENAKMGFIATSFASPEILVIIGGIGLLIGGLLLLVGFKTKLAAALLILMIIPITLTIQVANPEGLGPLFKNIGLTGGLIFFFFNGSLYYGVDTIFQNNKLNTQKHEKLN